MIGDIDIIPCECGYPDVSFPHNCEDEPCDHEYRKTLAQSGMFFIDKCWKCKDEKPYFPSLNEASSYYENSGNITLQTIYNHQLDHIIYNYFGDELKIKLGDLIFEWYMKGVNTGLKMERNPNKCTS